MSSTAGAAPAQACFVRLLAIEAARLRFSGRIRKLATQRSARLCPPRRAGFVSRPAASASPGGLVPRGSLARRQRPGMGSEARRRRQGGALSRSRNKAHHPGRGVPLGCRPAGHLLCRRSSACPPSTPASRLRESAPAGRATRKEPSRGQTPNPSPLRRSPSQEVNSNAAPLVRHCSTRLERDHHCDGPLV